MNPWHDIEVGEDAPEVVNALIEIPRASRAKYELDKQTGLLKLDRVLFSSMHYPENYGLIPQTLGEDGDPLDVIVVSHASIPSMCLVEVSIIGVMHMIDGGEVDDKLIAVAKDDVTVNHMQKLEDLPPHFGKEVQQFFLEYKNLEGKSVEVSGFSGKDTAQEIISNGITAYQEKFSEKAA